MEAKKPIDVLLYILQVCVDFLMVYFSYIFSYTIYTQLGNWSPYSIEDALVLSSIPGGLCVIVFILASVYRCEPGPMGLEQLRRLIFAYFWSGLMTISLTFFTKVQDYSRITVTLGLVLGFFAVLIGRAMIYKGLSLLRSSFRLEKRVLILGAGKVGKTLARNLLSTPGGIRVVGFLDDLYPSVTEVSIKIGETEFKVPVVGNLATLEERVSNLKANEVIVAMTRAGLALHQDLFERVKNLKVSFSLVPSALDLMLTGAEAYSIGRIPLFRLGERPEFILTPVLKRTFDLVGAVFLLIVSAPVLLLSALAIKLDSPGPVLFIHKRSGKNGVPFNLIKFRSMRVTTDPYATKNRTDNSNNVTRVGQFLRRTSIDELPQLLNVITGDMSLVGPRPEMPFIVDTYDDLQRLRLSVKPGLTGVWQISADRANPIHENIDYDLYYLENQSFWLDLAILIKTFTSVVRGIGAY